MVWIVAVAASFLAGLGTGRWLWKTGEALPDSFTAAQSQVPQGFSTGIEFAQVFTLGVAGSVALIVFLLAAILVRLRQSNNGDPKDR